MGEGQWECAHVSVSAGTQGQRESDPLDLNLQEILSAGTQTLVCSKNNPCFEPPNHLSSTSISTPVICLFAYG